MSSGKVLLEVVIYVLLKENDFYSRPVKRVNAQRNTSTYGKGLEPLNKKTPVNIESKPSFGEIVRDSNKKLQQHRYTHLMLSDALGARITQCPRLKCSRILAWHGP